MYDAVIIGGGVVGLSILRAALLSGYSNVVLIERRPDICDGASGRNSGVLCTGVDAPRGSLERALIRDSISNVDEFCREHNVPARACGSLVCSWPWDDDDDDDENKTKKSCDENDENGEGTSTSRDGLESVLHESHTAGDADARILSSREVARLEPSLSNECRGAVHIPGETVVDPWLFTVALAAHSREMAENYHGRRRRRRKRRGDDDDDDDDGDDVIRTGREVVAELSSFDGERGVWNLVTRRTGCEDSEKEEEELGAEEVTTITARCVINAAGIDSDLVQSRAAASSSAAAGDARALLPPPDFEARPRRGQYAIFAAPAGEEEEGAERRPGRPASPPPPHSSPRHTTIPLRPIQPVPTRFTKGIFVYSTLYDQVVAGPTARDQPSRTDDAPEPDVAAELAAHASRVLGRRRRFDYGSDDDAMMMTIGEYVGIRPGTSQGDYQIRLHPGSNWITVGGIRSTGLTASLGIGRHVVQSLLPAIVPPPPRPDDEPPTQPPPTPLPDVKDLVEQYHRRGDGRVVVGGHEYRVTHPLTRLGWDARTGLAA